MAVEKVTCNANTVTDRKPEMKVGRILFGVPLWPPSGGYHCAKCGSSEVGIQIAHYDYFGPISEVAYFELYPDTVKEAVTVYCAACSARDEETGYCASPGPMPNKLLKVCPVNTECNFCGAPAIGQHISSGSNVCEECWDRKCFLSPP